MATDRTINTEKISSKKSNQDITIEPSGTGDVIVSSGTANRVPYFDASKKLASSAVTDTELGYVSGVTSSIQTQLDAKVGDIGTPSDNAVIRADGTGGLTLQDSGVIIDDTDNVTGVTSLTSGDVTVSNGTANRAVAFDASKNIVASSVTDTELGYVSGVTSAIQTQLDGKMVDPMTTTGDIIYESTGPQRLGIGTAGQVLTVSGGLPSWANASLTPVAPTSKTTTYTATTSDETILADTSGGAWTLTLYAASGNSGKKITIKKVTSDTNALTIDGNASETIDGATSFDIINDNQAVTLVCDGSNWHKISDQKGAHSMVRLHTGNGHGSTNTRIRRFTTTVTNTGSAITYADSSTAGASFTVNESGVYHISYSDGHSTAFSHGISLNSSELTTDIENITTADILAQNALGGNLDCTLNCSWSGYLAANDVIRPHTDANPSFGTRVLFTIAKIGL